MVPLPVCPFASIFQVSSGRQTGKGRGARTCSFLSASCGLPAGRMEVVVVVVTVAAACGSPSKDSSCFWFLVLFFFSLKQLLYPVCGFPNKHKIHSIMLLPLRGSDPCCWGSWYRDTSSAQAVVAPPPKSESAPCCPSSEFLNAPRVSIILLSVIGPSPLFAPLALEMVDATSEIL